MVLLFFFEKTSIYFLCGLLLIMLLVPVGKLSNSRFQMFYKIDALKNLAILTGKHLCWSFFSINFIRKILQHGCFYVNIAKCLSTAFLLNTPFHYTFLKFYVMIEFLGILWVQNWYLSYFLCHRFVFLQTLVLESEVHCYFVYILFLYQNF